MGEQRRIFEKFYRLDPNLTRGVGGTGLGLYICRELYAASSGSIWVESRGRLRLDVHRGDPAGGAGARRGGASPGLQRGLSKGFQEIRECPGSRVRWGCLGGHDAYGILVAEDDEDFLAALETVLEADGRFAVAGRARNGREAVEIAGRLQVDAIVMDIEMPELDGVEATRRLPRD